MNDITRTSKEKTIAEIISVMESARDHGERCCEDLVQVHVGHICTALQLLKQMQSSHEPPAVNGVKLDRLRYKGVEYVPWENFVEQVQKLQAENQQLRASQPPDSAPIAPIAKLIVSEDDVVRAVMYAPGLPPGEHDLYPEGWLPDDHRDQTITSLCDRIERIFCIAIDQKLTHVERIKQIQEWSAGFMQPPCSTATKGNAP